MLTNQLGVGDILEVNTMINFNKLFGRKQKPNIPHWIIHDVCWYGTRHECSVCGAEFGYEKTIHYDDPCPICGAVMDVEAEEVIEYGYENCGR